MRINSCPLPVRRVGLASCPPLSVLPPAADISRSGRLVSNVPTKRHRGRISQCRWFGFAPGYYFISLSVSYMRCSTLRVARRKPPASGNIGCRHSIVFGMHSVCCRRLCPTRACRVIALRDVGEGGLAVAVNGGVRIHYEILGSGLPLVLQHGLTLSMEAWHQAGYVEA